MGQGSQKALDNILIVYDGCSYIIWFFILLGIIYKSRRYDAKGEKVIVKTQSQKFNMELNFSIESITSLNFESGIFIPL